MAPWTYLLLPALFISLLLIVPSHCIVDPTSTTLAISPATSTVCGITSGTQNHTILCTRFPESANSTASPKYPTISFNTIFGGPNFICSLRSGGGSFYCLDGVDKLMKRIYNGTTNLSHLSIGARQVAAITEDRRKIRWWRYGCHNPTKGCGYFPVSGDQYHSLTSGDDFSCALNRTNNVQCWGPGATPIQGNFSGIRMSSLTAGGGRMCGQTEHGYLKCTGDRSNVPPGGSFEFTSLAIGSNETCAISIKSGSVICWGQNGKYFPMAGTRFAFIVAGVDLTCSLTTDAPFEVACWGVNVTNSLAFIRSLPKILPGVCVQDTSICNCGFNPDDSGDLCGVSGVICRKYTDSCQFSPPINDIGKESVLEWFMGLIYFVHY